MEEEAEITGLVKEWRNKNYYWIKDRRVMGDDGDQLPNYTAH